MVTEIIDDGGDVYSIAGVVDCYRIHICDPKENCKASGSCRHSLFNAIEKTTNRMCTVRGCDIIDYKEV